MYDEEYIANYELQNGMQLQRRTARTVLNLTTVSPITENVVLGFILMAVLFVLLILSSSVLNYFRG